VVKHMPLEDIAAEALRRNKPLRGAITCAGIQQMVPALDYPWGLLLHEDARTVLGGNECSKDTK
jgi:hypothetical protein